MEVTCPGCGATVVINGLGRKKRDYAFQNVLVAYQNSESVAAAARKLDMPPGTVWNILKRHGVFTPSPDPIPEKKGKEGKGREGKGSNPL